MKLLAKLPVVFVILLDPYFEVVELGETATPEGEVLDLTIDPSDGLVTVNLDLVGRTCICSTVYLDFPGDAFRWFFFNSAGLSTGLQLSSSTGDIVGSWICWDPLSATLEAGFGCLAGHSPAITFNYVGGEIVELKVEALSNPVRWVANEKCCCVECEDVTRAECLANQTNICIRDKPICYAGENMQSNKVTAGCGGPCTLEEVNPDRKCKKFGNSCKMIIACAKHLPLSEHFALVDDKYAECVAGS